VGGVAIAKTIATVTSNNVGLIPPPAATISTGGCVPDIMIYADTDPRFRQIESAHDAR